MKKPTLGLVISGITLCLLCACSQFDNQNTSDSLTSSSTSSSASSKEGVTLTFWHYYGDYVESQLKEIVSEFHATVGAQEQITVNLVGKSSIAQLETQVTESSLGVVYAEEMPDIFLSYSDKVLELQGLDMIADLSLYFSEEQLEKFIPEFVESGYVGGMQSILPLVKSTELVFINETLWEDFAQETGYTKEDLSTWQGIYEVSQGYYDYTDGQTPEIPNDGKAFFGIDSLQNYILIAVKQMGSDIFLTDELNQSKVLAQLEAAFELYVNGISYGYFANIGKFRTDDIRSGDIIAYAGSSASFSYFPHWIETKSGEKMDIEWSPLPYPYFEGGQPYVLSQGAGLVITKKDGVQEEAAGKFLNFFLDYNIDFAIDSGYIPVVTEFLGDNAEDNSYLAILEEKGLSENEIKTYGLVVEQIRADQLYQPEAFHGTHAVRSELALALEQTANTALEVVRSQLATGMTLEEIKEERIFSQQFQLIMSNITTKLASQGIHY